MNYHIAADSCTDPQLSMRNDPEIDFVPLTLIVGDETIIDDASFDQESFLKKVAACPTAPSSACPSPEAFMEAYGRDNLDAYGITLSAELSGSYNSAVLGAKLLQEEFPNKKIHVFNSKSACCGQTLILLKIKECMAEGMTFEETVKTVEHYISEQTTLFVLETLESLRKNGRLSHLESLLIHALNIRPVMSSTPEGNIQKIGIGRGMKKALTKMVDHIGTTVVNQTAKTLAITHCNCRERAEWVKAEIMKRYSFRDIIILDAAGVASLYACDGGIVVAY